MSDFVMPVLGADMTEGTLLEWLVSPGDRVRRGDIVAVVDTSKSAIDVEAFADGVVTELLVEPGTTVPVGTPLAVIDGSAGERAVRRDTGGAATAPPRPRPAPSVPVAAAPSEAAHSDLRRAIGDLMARSAREIPHYYLGLDVDVTPATDWLREHNAGRPVPERVVPAAIVLRAVALAAADVPEVNGHLVHGGFEAAMSVDLGVAVSLRTGGLVAPTMSGVESRSIDEIMAELRGIVGRARRGRLTSSDAAPASLTVTNLGDQGVDEVYGVVSAPQVALVGVGRIARRPWAIDGAVAIRDVSRLSLAADHRVSDGHRGGEFLLAIADRLSRPELL